MPGFIGKKLCPGLVIVRPNFSKYRQVSEEVRKVLIEYDPHFSPVGLDESYLNLNECVARRMSMQSAVCQDAGRSRGLDERRAMESGCCKLGRDGRESIPFTAATGQSHQYCKLSSKPLADDSLQEPFSIDNSSKLHLERSENKSRFLKTHDQSSCQEWSYPSKEENEMENEEVEEEENTMMEEKKEKERDENEFSTAAHLSLSHWKCAEEVVEEIRARIEQATGLTASAGIAPNKMLAKVASDMNKPNGQFTVPATREGVLQFVRNLPIRKVYRIALIFCGSKFSRFSRIRCHSQKYFYENLILTLCTTACFYSVFAKFFQRNCQQQFVKI